MKILMEELWRRVPPPAQPDQAAGELTASQLGSRIPLPNDYLAFMKSYGPGLFCSRNGVATIWDVSSPTETQTAEMLFIHRENSQLRKERNFTYFPEDNGLLPWGCDDDLYTYFWETSPHKPWSIVIHDRHSYIPIAKTFLEFLIGSLEKSFHGHKYLYMLNDNVKYCPRSIAMSQSMDWRFWKGMPTQD